MSQSYIPVLRSEDGDFRVTAETTSLLPEKFPPLAPEEGLQNPCRYLIDSAHIPTIFKFSNKLLFFPQSAGITVKTCNLARTAAAQLHFAADFFGAAHTFDWPGVVPCCSLGVADLLLVIKKLDRHRSISHFVLDLEFQSDGAICRVFYKNGVNILFVLPTYEVYANSLPVEEVPRQESSVLNVLGSEFRTVLTSLGRNVSEIGFFMSEYGVVLHTLCSRSLRAKMKRSAVLMTDLISATLVSKECLLEVDVRELELLAYFAHANDAVMKFYFTATEEPLFVVVDLNNLCSITFILSTGMVEAATTKSVIYQMIPSIEDEGKLTTIRTSVGAASVNSGNVSVPLNPPPPLKTCDVFDDRIDLVTQREFCEMDAAVLGRVGRAKTPPEQRNVDAGHDVHVVNSVRDKSLLRQPEPLAEPERELGQLLEDSFFLEDVPRNPIQDPAPAESQQVQVLPTQDSPLIPMQPGVSGDFDSGRARTVHRFVVDGSPSLSQLVRFPTPEAPPPGSCPHQPASAPPPLTKRHRLRLFEDLETRLTPDEEGLACQLRLKAFVPFKDSLPAKFVGGGQVTDEEREVRIFINERPQSFWRKAFRVRPLSSS